jgi:RNA polymerase sigma-70 factor (ECF subfamily)
VPQSREHIDALISASTSDEEVLDRFLRGDDKAYVVLYERYEAKVLTYLRTILREHPDAGDDLFQETFVRLFRERKRFAGGANDGEEYKTVANVRGWIFRVAHNLAISYLRSVRQTVSLDDEDMDASRWDERLMVPVEESFEQLYGEEDPLASEDMYQKLRACVELLPQSLRQVYVLRELNGLEYDEVATIVGCSQEAARMRLSRARSTLRKALEKYL